MTDVRIPVDRLRLGGRLLMPPVASPRAGIVFLHGWGGNQRQDAGIAKKLLGLDCACLTFDLRGHGPTRAQQQTVTRADNLRDAFAAYDFLVSQTGIDPDRIGVIGHSYGAYLAMLLSGERQVRWLALRVPALYKDDDFDRPKTELNYDGELPGYRRRRLTPADNRALGQAARFQGDALIVESEHDTTIPHEVIANYLAAFAKARSVSHQVIPGADHALSRPRWRDAFASMLLEWLGQHLEAPEAAREPAHLDERPRGAGFGGGGR
jgi:uncharacterized protein